MHGRAVSGAHDQPIGADQGFVKVWQAAVLSLLLTHEKIQSGSGGYAQFLEAFRI
jgi:hypothetical protein